MQNWKFLAAAMFALCGDVFSLAAADPAPFVLDMVHNNPGEKPFDTKYNDPEFLKSQGFTGTVPHWHINCAVNYDSFKRRIPQSAQEREWIAEKAREISRKLDECHAAGIAVYPFTDFVVFPKSVWDKYGKEIEGVGKVEGTGGSDARARKPNLNSKLTQELLRAQIDAIFTTFPSLDGLTLRFGETYLHDTPFHMGGSPITKGDAGIDDHVLLLNILRDEVCVKRDKKLFYRTWDSGYNFHNNPDYYKRVTDRVEPHPNLIFSIKYPQDDFQRMSPFNPALGLGKHRQIVECQSRMEGYGKGAHPYYTAKGVIEGFPETKYEIEFGKHRFTGNLTPKDAPRGLRDILDRNLFAGVVTWSHGGGWQGPYITHEIWTDLNTSVMARWARNTDLTEEEAFMQFADSIGFTGMNADIFRNIALLTEEGVRKGQCNSYTFNNVWWARDEFFSAAANAKVIKEILDRGLQSKVLAEKAEASAIWSQIEALSRQLDCKDADLLEAVQVSCSYGRIKYHLIERMWQMMLINAEIERGKPLDREKLQEILASYDALWHEWAQLKESSWWCATLYTDMAYRNKREGSIGELADHLRAIAQ